MTSAASHSDKTYTLDDGRLLGYAEYGNPTGHPLLYFHVHPGSRLEARFLAEQATLLGIRLIGIDRPGMGLSSYNATRRILDWPDDVVALADSLHIDRFTVAGFSGGSPYALACAFKISDRLSACGIISGVGNPGRFLSFLSLWLPHLIMPLSQRFFRDVSHAKKTLMRVGRTWAEPDRKALASPLILDTLAVSLVEGLRQGAKGGVYDGTLLGKQSWGFRLEEISLRRIYLWHGALDKDSALHQAQTVAARLEQCQATFYPDEGHISVIVNHQEEIVKTLMAHQSKKETR